jgi:hypothetical protein
MLLGLFGNAGDCESALAEVTTLQAFEGKILVEIVPVQTEWGNFNIVELGFGPATQPGIFSDRETQFGTVFHLNDHGRSRVVNPIRVGVHSAHAPRVFQASTICLIVSSREMVISHAG